VFEFTPELDVAYDLLECGVALCSQSVPPLFADNFDCQTMDDFVGGILENDLVENTLYARVLKPGEGYAARVNNMHNYLAVAADVVQRWAHPVVPESANSGCRMQRRNVYKRKDAQLAAGCWLEADVVLGRRCHVAEGATLNEVSLGDDAEVGNRASIRCSVIMRGARVGDGCQIAQSVIGPDVVLGTGCVVPPRCILAEGVHLPANTTLKELTRLVAKPPEDGFSDEEEEAVPDSNGQYGPKAHLYFEEDSDDEEEEEEKPEKDADALAKRRWGLPLSDQEQDDEDVTDTDSEASSDFPPIDHVIDDDDAKQFHTEVLESLQRGIKEKIEPANLTVEINSSRHAYAATWSMVIHSVTMSLLTISLNAEEGRNGPKLLKEIKRVIGQVRTPPLASMGAPTSYLSLSVLVLAAHVLQKRADGVGLPLCRGMLLPRERERLRGHCQERHSRLVRRRRRL